MRNALLVALCLVADQGAKAFVVRHMALGERLDLLPVLALLHARNEGIAFSLFAGLGDTGLALLAVAVLVFVVFLWLKTPPGRWRAHLAFAFIAGGALGNLVDRVRLGYVVDYVLVHTAGWSFAVFNLADALITIGAALVVLDEFLASRQPRQANGTAPPAHGNGPSG